VGSREVLLIRISLGRISLLTKGIKHFSVTGSILKGEQRQKELSVRELVGSAPDGKGKGRERRNKVPRGKS